MSLAPLATSADVEARLGRALTDPESLRVDALLRDASAVVRGRNQTGQDFTRATTTVRRRILDGHVVLPQRPVNSVTSVNRPTGEPVFRYRWNGESTVYVFLWNPQTDFETPWRPGFDVVDVTYDHGYDDDDIPDVVTGVVANIVARAMGDLPDNAGLVEENLEGIYSYKRDHGASGPFTLQEDEIAALRPYGAGARSRTVRLV